MGLSKRKCCCIWSEQGHGLPVRRVECDHCITKRMAKDPRESAVEDYLTQRVESAGGMCEKFMTGKVGPPDRIITWPEFIEPAVRGIQWVELKKLDKKPESPQHRDHRRRRALGQMVFVLDSKEQVDWYMEIARFFTWAEYIAHCRAQGEL